MAKEKLEITPIYLEQLFEVIFFPVHEKFLGFEFKFKFEGQPVVVQIPSKETGEKEKSLEIRSYRDFDGKKRDITYGVSRIRILVDTQIGMKLPNKALETNSIDSRIYSDHEKEKFEELLKKFGKIPPKVFSYFSKVFRWKSKKNILRLSHQIPPSVNNSGELLAGDKLRRIWHGPILLVVRGDSILSKTVFRKTQDALKAGNHPPPWFDFLFDAKHRSEMGDKEGAIMAFAVACESVLRSLFWLNSPKVENEGYKQIIDGINVRAIINHRKKFEFWDDKLEEAFDNKMINKLFNWRNSLMHNAIVPELNPKSLQDLNTKVTAFIFEADKKI